MSEKTNNKKLTKEEMIETLREARKMVEMYTTDIIKIIDALYISFETQSPTPTEKL